MRNVGSVSTAQFNLSQLVVLLTWQSRSITVTRAPKIGILGGGQLGKMLAMEAVRQLVAV